MHRGPLKTDAARPHLAAGSKRPVLAVGAVLLAGVSVFGVSRLLASPPKADYRTSPVQRANVTQTVSVSGSVNAASQVHLSFKSGGKLAAVMVQTGQTVAAGDLLAKLDDSDQKVALQQAQANLNAAQAKYSSTIAGSDLVPRRHSDG